MLGWALRASSKLLFFSTRTSSSSAISARLATTSVQRSRNFIIVAENVGSGLTGEIGWAFFLVFFTPLVKVWESSWYFVSTATNVAQARRKQRGVGGSAHAPLSGSKQFVLKCDWTAAACTWKWMTALLLTRPHSSADWLITHRSRKAAPQAALRACGLIARKRGSNVLSVLFRCAIYSSSATNLIC